VAEAAEKKSYREWEAVTRVLGDLLEREQLLNKKAGQPVNYTDDELEHVAHFNQRLIMNGA